MNPSDHLAQYLSPRTQKAYAEIRNTGTVEPPTASSILDDETQRKLFAEHGPSLLARDIQAKIHNLIFGPNVKTLEEAKRFHQLLVDSLDMDSDAAKKKRG